MVLKRAAAVRHSSVPAPRLNPPLRSLILYLAAGPIPVPLQFGPEGPTEEPVTGNKNGPKQAGVLIPVVFALNGSESFLI